MLPRIVLLLIQVAAAWFLADPIKSALPTILGRQYDIFVYALLYAAIVMIVGFIGALILKGLRVPTLSTFVASLVLAAVFAAVTLISAINAPLQEAVPILRSSPKLYPLIGAVVGYMLKR
jgi:hypothetical protein